MIYHFFTKNCKCGIVLKKMEGILYYQQQQTFYSIANWGGSNSVKRRSSFLDHKMHILCSKLPSSYSTPCSKILYTMRSFIFNMVTITVTPVFYYVLLVFFFLREYYVLLILCVDRIRATGLMYPGPSPFLPWAKTGLVRWLDR